MDSEAGWIVSLKFVTKWNSLNWIFNAAGFIMCVIAKKMHGIQSARGIKSGWIWNHVGSFSEVSNEIQIILMIIVK